MHRISFAYIHVRDHPHSLVTVLSWKHGSQTSHFCIRENITGKDNAHIVLGLGLALKVRGLSIATEALSRVLNHGLPYWDPFFSHNPSFSKTYSTNPSTCPPVPCDDDDDDDDDDGHNTGERVVLAYPDELRQAEK